MSQERDTWSVAEAKARFSEVIKNAQLRAQTVDNRGMPVAVVLGIDEYRALRERADRSAPESRLSAFLRASETLRRDGGAEIKPTRRQVRPTPFSEEG